MSAFTPQGMNPFTPGMGETPPVIAGRKQEQGRLSQYLDRMTGSKRGKAMVIYAPRGTGKTVLFNWLQAQCEQRGMRVVRTNPRKSGNVIATAELQTLLLPDTTPDTSRLSVGGGMNLGAAAFNINWVRGDAKKTGLFKDHLRDACRDAPRVLLIDEAHHWTGDDRRDLLGIFQEIPDRHPFLAIIAGTPGLMTNLKDETTFVERAVILNPGLLDADSAIEAIAKPLNDGGINIDKDAIAWVADDAQRYPYFLQLWGEALWDYAAAQGKDRLKLQDAQAVRPDMDAERAGFYSGRFDEIRANDSLRLAATAVADAYHAGGRYDKDAIAEIIHLALATVATDPTRGNKKRKKKAEALLQELDSKGYIWQPRRQQFMQAGIPSLMDYVRQNRADAHPPFPPAEAERASRAAMRRKGIAA